MLRRYLVDFVRRRSGRPDLLEPARADIGFARRFATYKRGTILLTDLDRLARILGDPARPVQIVFAGKAHPRDDPGKELIQRDRRRHARSALRGADRLRRGLRHQRRAPPGAGRGRLAQHPAAAAGGVRHQRAEGRAQRRPQPLGARRLVGRGVRRARTASPSATARCTRTPTSSGQRDAAALYETLEQQVVPLFYDRDADGVAARLGRADEALDHEPGLALQRRPHGHRLRPAQLPAAGGRLCSA